MSHPTQLARVRLSPGAPSRERRVAKLPHRFARLLPRCARHRASRRSFELDRESPRTTLSRGTRASRPRCVRTDVCTSELSLRAPHTSRVPGARLRRSSRSARPEGSSPSCSPARRSSRAAPPRAEASERAGTEGLGAPRCERDRGMARFHDARLRFGRSDEGARGVVFRRVFEATHRWHPCRLLRFARVIEPDRHATSEAAEIDSARRLVKRRRASLIRGAFSTSHRRTAGWQPKLQPEPLDPLRFPDAHVMRIIEARRTALPFIRRRAHERLRAVSSSETRAPFTGTCFIAWAFDPSDAACALLWLRRRPVDVCNTYDVRARAAGCRSSYRASRSDAFSPIRVGLACSGAFAPSHVHARAPFGASTYEATSRCQCAPEGAHRTGPIRSSQGPAPVTASKPLLVPDRAPPCREHAGSRLESREAATCAPGSPTRDLSRAEPLVGPRSRDPPRRGPRSHRNRGACRRRAPRTWHRVSPMRPPGWGPRPRDPRTRMNGSARLCDQEHLRLCLHRRVPSVTRQAPEGGSTAAARSEDGFDPAPRPRRFDRSARVGLYDRRCPRLGCAANFMSHDLHQADNK